MAVSDYKFPLVKALVDAGVVPPECRRITIDIKAGNAVMVTYETYALRGQIDHQSVVDAVASLRVKREVERVTVEVE